MAHNSSKDSYTLTDTMLDKLFSRIEKTVGAAIDVSVEADKILAMTPQDGYKKKIELIAGDIKMSTEEKIKAINEVEDKYAQDFSNSTEKYKEIIWAKAGATLVVVAGVVLMVASPNGRTIAKNVLGVV